MLSHDLAMTVVAERARAIRDVARARALPARPSLLARAVTRVAGALRPRPQPRAVRSPGTLARDLGGVVAGVSARAGDTHGQGAC